MGTERHEGGDREDAEMEVELELDYWATEAVPFPSLSPSLGLGRGRQWQRGLGVAYRTREGWRRARSSWLELTIEMVAGDPKPDYALFLNQNRSTQNDPWKTTNIDVIEGYVSFTKTPLGIKMVEK